MPYTYICQDCNNTFQSPNKNVKYCNKTCYTKAQRRRPPTIYQSCRIRCKHCEIEFSCVVNAKRKFCTRRCQNAHLVGKSTKKNRKTTHQCDQCGVVFHDSPSAKRRFCSQPCRHNSLRQPKIRVTCANCGHSFDDHRSSMKDSKLRFCSPACKNIYLCGDKAARWKPDVPLICEQCGMGFGRKPHLAFTRFCSRKCKNHWLRNNIISPTNIEVAMAKLLTDLGIEYEEQVQIERWSCDFLVPSMSLIIECDGDYWHQLPQVRHKDVIKDAWLQDRGYRVLHILENIIMKHPDECRRRVIEATDRRFRLSPQVPP